MWASRAWASATRRSEPDASAWARAIRPSARASRRSPSSREVTARMPSSRARTVLSVKPSMRLLRLSRSTRSSAVLSTISRKVSGSYRQLYVAR